MAVLDVEDGFVGVGHGLVAFAFTTVVPLMARFVDCKLDNLLDIGDHINGVFEPNGETLGGGLFGEVLEVRNVVGSVVAPAILVVVLLVR
jgi:hypothetical protein